MSKNKTHTPTLAERIEEFFSQSYIGCAESTIVRHRQIMRDMEIWTGAKPFGDAKWYAAWMQECFKRYSHGCAGLTLTVTRRFLTWLENSDIIVKSPARIVKQPPILAGPGKKPFTPEDYQALKAATTGTSMHWAVILAWATGFRLSDVCLLTWASVNLEKLELTIVQHKMRRHGKQLTIPFQPRSDLHQALLQKAAVPRLESWPNIPAQGIYYVDPELALLYKRQPGSSFARGLQTRFDAAMAKAGIKGKSFHSFRVAMASALANSGISLALACKITGHSDPKVFMRYVVADQQAVRDAIIAVRSS